MESPNVVLWCKVCLNLCQNQPLSIQGQPSPNRTHSHKTEDWEDIKAQPKPKTMFRKEKYISHESDT